jgi:lipoyl(octanoyl) transferase
MDLAPFHLINPCGYPDLDTVDLASLGVKAESQEIAKALVAELQQQLQ